MYELNKSAQQTRAVIFVFSKKVKAKSKRGTQKTNTNVNFKTQLTFPTPFKCGFCLFPKKTELCRGLKKTGGNP